MDFLILWLISTYCCALYRIAPDDYTIKQLKKPILMGMGFTFGAFLLIKLICSYR